MKPHILLLLAAALLALAAALLWTAREPAAQHYIDRIDNGTELLHWEQEAE